MNVRPISQVVDCRRRNRRLVGRRGAQAAHPALRLRSSRPSPRGCTCRPDRCARCRRSSNFIPIIGLREADTVVRAGQRLPARNAFEDWSAGRPDLCSRLRRLRHERSAASPFHQHWLRAHDLGEVAPFDRFCGAAEHRRRRPILPSADVADAPAGLSPTGCTSTPNATAR